MSLSKVQLLDCTIRDGGYINNWRFSLDFAKALYRAVSEAGVDYMETGFVFGESRETKSPWANYHYDPTGYSALKNAVPNGCRMVGLLNYGGFEIKEIPPSVQMPFDMLRVVCHRADAAAAATVAAELSQLGYETTVNFMGVSNYTPVELIELIQIINDHKNEVGYFYVADSFGSLMPEDTRRIVDTLRYGTQARLGFHPHNNLQMAFANSLAAIQAGASIVDGSVFGMGRGAGNLFTEVMVAYLEAQGESRYRLLPLLQFADLFMEPLREQYDWGLSLPQMISGILKCHPNYPTNLLDFKMHTADDIYKMLKNLPDDHRRRYKKTYMDEARSAFLKEKIRQDNAVSDGLKKAAEDHDSVLLLCGGSSVQKYQVKLEKLVEKENCYVMAVNNPASPVPADAVFFGNQRRLLQHQAQVSAEQEVILGPTINEKVEESMPLENISRVMLKKAQGAEFSRGFPETSGVMGILVCAELGFKKVYIAGMDGFSPDTENYYYNEPDRIEEIDTQEVLNQTVEQELILTAKVLNGAVELTLVTPSRFYL